MTFHAAIYCWTISACVSVRVLFCFVFVFFNLALPVHHTQSVDPKCHQQVVLCGYGFVVLLHFNGFYVVYQSELSTVCTF